MVKALKEILEAFIAVIYNSIIRGFVMYQMWMWFAVKEMNLPEVGIFQFAAITLVTMLIKSPNKGNKQLALDEILINNMIISGVVLAAGWIIKEIMNWNVF